MTVMASATRASLGLCLGFLLTVPLPAAAQAPSAMLEAVATCLTIVEREARHACYDRAEGIALQQLQEAPRPQAAAPAAAVVVPAVPDRPATTVPTVEDFGKVAARVEQGAEGKAELVDRVVELREVQHKQWQITLESGQVWRQMLSQTYNLRPGHEVRIAPINEGPNHRLSSPQVAGTIQVRRVR